MRRLESPRRPARGPAKLVDPAAVLITLSIIAVLTAFTPVAGLAVPGDVIDAIDAPASTPTGMTFDGKHLWVADRLTDLIYAVDPRTGEVARTLPAPGFIPRGLAWDGSLLWCIDGEENRIIAIDPVSGISTRSLEAPTPSPQGLAWDGEDLWLADDKLDVLCKISTEDGTVIEQIPAPLGSPTGLAWWRGYLWCADRRQDRIYLVAPDHEGEVVLSFDSPGAYARGLATDGKVLWNVDYQEDRIYKLVIDDGETIQTFDEHTLDLLLTHEFRNYGPGEVTQLDVYIAIPHDMPSQKLLSEVQFTPEPTGIITDRWGQRIAHFRFDDLPLALRRQVTMTVRAELSAMRQFIFPHKVGKLDDIPRDISDTYLVDEDKYRLDDPRIRDAVAEAVGDETNPFWMMRDIHRYIREHMHYELAGGWNVAPRIIERGSGSCSEYTFVFIAMCRAAGVPARYVGSVVIRGDDASADDVFHRWSQVYLPGYGWIHVDPSGGDKKLPGQVSDSIGVLSNRFLITTESGGASEVLAWNYNYNQTWLAVGPVKIHTEAVGEWSPVDAQVGD